MVDASELERCFESQNLIEKQFTFGDDSFVILIVRDPESLPKNDPLGLTFTRNRERLLHEYDISRLWAYEWDSGYVLSILLLYLKSFVCSKSVIELGAGRGLPGIAAAHIGADVTLTDFSPSALSFAQLMIKANSVQDNCKTAFLDWTNLPTTLQTYELVIACDVLYTKGKAKSFAETLVRVLENEGTGVLIDAENRTFPAEFESTAKLLGLSVLQHHLPRVHHPLCVENYFICTEVWHTAAESLPKRKQFRTAFQEAVKWFTRSYSCQDQQ
eukprot:TRINITY_DN11474_c0_g1_i1.p1 TRINITY_DN11474_c0_g1~~TRINITY_DN11474_c0_g1_i1.p1  ORF type:complete len:272 (+),score=27.46 TRINITY_DN11474_c0_g1_i1:3-818(+)